MFKNVQFEIEVLKRLAGDTCYHIEFRENGEVYMEQFIDEDNNYTYENTATALLDWYDILVGFQREFGDWRAEVKYIENVILNKNTGDNGVYKIEVNAWKNEELGLILLENRALTVDEEDMIKTHLDVISSNGDSVYLDDVDEIEWTFVETAYDGYSNCKVDKFMSALSYIHR